MYSNERGSRFNIIDLIVRIIFFLLFVFVLYWLFSNKMPNLTPFYSDVFRDNLEHMQKAGKSYFTDKLLPDEVGEEAKITLAEMFEKKLVLPFVDKNGNSCNQYESYVSVIKRENHYELKTNLVCNDESDFLIEIIGCYTYCEDDKCEKTCAPEKIVEYQYKKAATKTKTTYSCSKGYTRKGNYCYKTSLVDKISAEKTVVTSKVDVIPAKLITSNPIKTKLEVIKIKNSDITTKVPVDKVSTPITKKEKVYVSAKTEQIYVPGEEYTYSCPTKKTERVCTTTTKTETYKCNCTSTVGSSGKTITTCNICSRSVPVESCSNVTRTVDKTCTGTTEGYYKTEYYCPSNATNSSGSGANLKCWYNKTVTTGYNYSCPSNATGSSGSDANLKCWYTETAPGGYSYKCPNDATTFTGSNETLECFKTTPGTSKYVCEDKTYTLVGKECRKTITGSFTELQCPSGYKLNGKVCEKYETEKVKAKVKKTKYKTYSYKWSEKTSLSGWTKTNKTRIKEGKIVCK